MNDTQYAQVFSNNAYFANVYLTNSRRNYCDPLKMFCKEFGVPQKLNVDGSKEQACKRTTFMNQVYMKGIGYHISDPEPS